MRKTPTRVLVAATSLLVVAASILAVTASALMGARPTIEPDRST